MPHQKARNQPLQSAVMEAILSLLCGAEEILIQRPAERKGFQEKFFTFFSGGGYKQL